MYFLSVPIEFAVTAMLAPTHLPPALRLPPNYHILHATALLFRAQATRSNNLIVEVFLVKVFCLPRRTTIDEQRICDQIDFNKP